MSHLKYNRSGFTIVELLIVVVVIAILAAITIVSYNGITTRAKETAVKSDLRNATGQLETEKITSGFYPTNQATLNNGAGVKLSNGNTVQFLASPSWFCVAVSSSTPFATNAYRTTMGGSMQAGTCEASVVTLAGSGATGTSDGLGQSASFQLPWGVAVDPSGNVFVADQNAIRRITPDGTVAIFAGSIASSGYVEGTGTTARFGLPYGLVSDSSGNIYVSDQGNDAIRRITPGGVVSTFAGGTQGYLDATGTAAQFDGPMGIARDTAGNLYVADANNNRIRRITTGAVVSTIAGSGTAGVANGTGTAAQFDNPYDIAVNSTGELFVVDLWGTVRKIAAGNVVTTFAGPTAYAGSYGYVDGTGTAARFEWTSGVAVDSNNNVYVTEEYGMRVRKITPAGVVSTFAGIAQYAPATAYADGMGTAARFGNVHGIDIGSNNLMYVVDGGNKRIRKIQI